MTHSAGGRLSAVNNGDGTISIFEDAELVGTLRNGMPGDKGDPGDDGSRVTALNNGDATISVYQDGVLVGTVAGVGDKGDPGKFFTPVIEGDQVVFRDPDTSDIVAQYPVPADGVTIVPVVEGSDVVFRHPETNAIIAQYPVPQDGEPGDDGEGVTVIDGEDDVTLTNSTGTAIIPKNKPGPQAQFVRTGSNQTIPANAATIVQLTQETIDTDESYTLEANGTVTINADSARGTVDATVLWGGSSAARQLIWVEVFRSGALISKTAEAQAHEFSDGTRTCHLNAELSIALEAGDNIRLMAYHNSLISIPILPDIPIDDNVDAVTNLILGSLQGPKGEGTNVINDGISAPNRTWSSEKINAEFPGLVLAQIQALGIRGVTDSVYSIFSAPVPSDDKGFSVAGSFFAGAGKGSSVWFWDAGADKSLADGVFLVDPGRLGIWAGVADETFDTFLQAQGGGQGLGCYRRLLLSDSLTSFQAGMLGDGQQIVQSYDLRNPTSGNVRIFEHIIARCAEAGIRFDLVKTDSFYRVTRPPRIPSKFRGVGAGEVRNTEPSTNADVNLAIQPGNYSPTHLPVVTLYDGATNWDKGETDLQMIPGAVLNFQPGDIVYIRSSADAGAIGSNLEGAQPIFGQMTQVDAVDTLLSTLTFRHPADFDIADPRVFKMVNSDSTDLLDRPLFSIADTVIEGWSLASDGRSPLGRGGTLECSFHFNEVRGERGVGYGNYSARTQWVCESQFVRKKAIDIADGCHNSTYHIKSLTHTDDLIPDTGQWILIGASANYGNYLQIDRWNTGPRDIQGLIAFSRTIGSKVVLGSGVMSATETIITFTENVEAAPAANSSCENNVAHLGTIRCAAITRDAIFYNAQSDGRRLVNNKVLSGSIICDTPIQRDAIRFNGSDSYIGRDVIIKDGALGNGAQVTVQAETYRGEIAAQVNSDTIVDASPEGSWINNIRNPSIFTGIKNLTKVRNFNGLSAQSVAPSAAKGISFLFPLDAIPGTGGSNNVDVKLFAFIQVSQSSGNPVTFRLKTNDPVNGDLILKEWQFLNTATERHIIEAVLVPQGGGGQSSVIDGFVTIDGGAPEYVFENAYDNFDTDSLEIFLEAQALDAADTMIVDMMEMLVFIP